MMLQPPTTKSLSLGVLGSGKGSNFRAILEAIGRGRCHAKANIIISDVADAGILDIGREHNIPAHHVAPGKYRTKLEPEIEQRVVDLLRDAGVDLVVLAGYMRVVKEPLLRAFPDRVINIHPSLLPKFPGLRAWEQAVKAGARVSGCTVHLVDSGIDSGPILAQREVDVLPTDDPATLHQRIQDAEHALYPWVIDQIARGEISLPPENAVNR
jgi:phosphoribosylglycinamide formyltransferase-1